MKLRDLTNPAFWGACGLGLGLLAAAPAYGQDAESASPETPVTSGLACNAGSGVFKDNENRPWVKVEASTANGIPVNFDMNLDLKLSGTIAKYNELTCGHITNQIHHLGSYLYKAAIVASEYEDLPQKAPVFTAQILDQLNGYLDHIIPQANSEARITELSIQNVQAPGLTPEQAQTLLTKGIQYDYFYDTGGDNPDHITVMSWDWKRVAYEIEVRYQPKTAAYDITGPDREKLRHMVFENIRRTLYDETVKRMASCIDKDSRFIESHAYINLTRGLENIIFPLELRIKKAEILDPQPTLLYEELLPSPGDRPDEPICTIEIEKAWPYRKFF